jgi:hypothetical protein
MCADVEFQAYYLNIIPSKSHSHEGAGVALDWLVFWQYYENKSEACLQSETGLYVLSVSPE